MTTLANFNANVDIVLQDKDGKIATGSIDYFIQNSAVQQYSKDRPFKRIKDVASSGGYDYTITSIFTGWIKGSSNIRQVEYPVDNNQNPNYIPWEEWTIYEDTTNEILRFLKISPNSGTIRVTYYTPHSVPNSDAATIYVNDEAAFVNLAASYCAQALANWYGEATDSTLGADAINYRDKSDIWNSRAKNLLQKYIDYMFPKEIGSASARKEFDTIYSSLGYTRLTHPSWSR